MTEEEAKTKWCPMVGISKAVMAVTGNAEGANKCIASDCMMWVKTKTAEKITGNISAVEYLPGKYVARPEKISISCGHCGLTK